MSSRTGTQWKCFRNKDLHAARWTANATTFAQPDMDEGSFKQLISGDQRGFRNRSLRGALRVLSWGYAATIGFRNLVYDVLPGMVHHADVPVICVGNITTGGTGKTPVVALTVQMLQDLGRCPGIVSRGYHADQDGGNDEKRVLSQLCPGVPHEQHSSRVLAVKRLLHSSPVDVVVMDDGYQHRRLHRDLNIVLIDATNPFGYGSLLPRGLLREPLRALRRADLVLITRSDLIGEAAIHGIQETILSYAPALKDRILCTCFQPTCLIQPDGLQVPVETVAVRSVFLMSGIGNPAAFRATCETLRTVVVGEAIYADHHHHSAADLEFVFQQAEANSADVVLTTQKDLVKLPSGSTGIFAVGIGCTFNQPSQLTQFRELLEHTATTA